MKKLMLLTIALALFAQETKDLAGTWQGTLAAGGRELRTVLKITKDDGKFTGLFYSIDQGGQPIPSGPITLQGVTVKVPMPGIGGAFEGKLSDDRDSITGTWTQGGPSLPLNLVRATSATEWPIPEPPKPLKPMAANAVAVFEVATIKPNNTGGLGSGIGIRGRHFTTRNTSLVNLLSFAYGLHPRQITGGPAWMESEKFDLDAQPDGEGQPNDKQWKTMVQKLLADRFQLTFHHDKKELSVYAIVVAKNGPKLTKSQGNPEGLPGLFFRGLGNLPVTNATIADFAGVLQSPVLDRPVLDQTGLTGRWDFVLTWTPDEFQFASLGGNRPPPSSDPSSAAPDLFTAMQQQLGLKLESTKAMTDIIVIDKVEKPTAN